MKATLTLLNGCLKRRHAQEIAASQLLKELIQAGYRTWPSDTIPTSIPATPQPPRRCGR
jgi:hypothetical protein